MEEMREGGEGEQNLGQAESPNFDRLALFVQEGFQGLANNCDILNKFFLFNGFNRSINSTNTRG